MMFIFSLHLWENKNKNKNESLKKNTENNKPSDKVEYFRVLKEEVGTILAGYEQLYKNAHELNEVWFIFLHYCIVIVKIIFFSFNRQQTKTKMNLTNQLC